MRYLSYCCVLPEDNWHFGIASRDFLITLRHAAFLSDYLRMQGFADARVQVLEAPDSAPFVSTFRHLPSDWRAMIIDEPGFE